MISFGYNVQDKYAKSIKLYSSIGTSEAANNGL